MKTLHNNYCNSKQGYLPLFLSDCLDLLDPVLTFDRLMGGIDLNKYLTDIPEYTTGRLRYNPVNMLKTVLFGFMTSGYCSLRELEDNCKPRKYPRCVITNEPFDTSRRHFRNYEKRPLVQKNCPKRYSFSQTGSFTRGDRPQSI